MLSVLLDYLVGGPSPAVHVRRRLSHYRRSLRAAFWVHHDKPRVPYVTRYGVERRP